MSLVFVVKSGIRHKTRFYQLVEEFKSFSLFERIEVRETRHAQHAITLAFQACNEGFEYVVAVGGDGTLNEVVNGVMQHPEKKSCVVFLPFGSANDFSLTIPAFNSAKELAEGIRKNKIRNIDVGLIKSQDENGKIHKNFFINVADAGIGATVVKKVNRSRKFWGARLAYAKAIISTFLTYEASEARILVDGQEIRKKILTIIVANGKAFGEGIMIAPDAKVDDGRFSIVVIGKVSVLEYLRYIPGLRKGKKIEHREVMYLSGKEISVEPIDHSLNVEYDGEFGGYAPVLITMHSEKLQMLVTAI